MIINCIAVEESIENKKEVTIEASIEDLDNTPTRFYFCDNENFRLAPVVWHRCYTQSEKYMQMISALELSSLRVFVPKDVDLFVVPIPMSWILVHRNGGVLCNREIGTFVNHEIFRKQKGSMHVLIRTTSALSRKNFFQK